MNKEQKAERVAQIAAAIRESEAVFAVDYRGISVPQAAELRTKLIEAGARFSVVKNTLTERAVDDVGADTLKEYLEGPTAFTFVSAERRRGDGREGAVAVPPRERRARVQGRDHERRAALDRPDRVDREAARRRRPARPDGRRARIADHRPRARAEPADLGPRDRAGPDPGRGQDRRRRAGGGAAAAGGRAGRRRGRETPAEEAPGDPVAEAETAEAETETETETEEAPSEGEEKEG